MKSVQLKQRNRSTDHGRRPHKAQSQLNQTAEKIIDPTLCLTGSDKLQRDIEYYILRLNELTK